MLGKTVTIVSDQPSEASLRALLEMENTAHPELAAINLELFPITDDNSVTSASVNSIFERLNPDHLVSIERPGRAEDGRFHNMRGLDITQHTAHIDALFIEASNREIPTTCIGDGGNEIGMGNVRDLIVQHVPNGPVLATVTNCTYPITAGYVT
jgi:hypothetical protein